MNSTAGDIICGSVSGLLKALTKDGDIGAKLTLGGNINATSVNGEEKSRHALCASVYSMEL